MAKVSFSQIGDLFYLAQEEDGRYSLFLNDPMKGGEKVDMTLEQYVEESLGKGPGDVLNPIVVRVAAGKLTRCTPLTEELLNALYGGESKGDFIKDMEGNYVDILSKRSQDKRFPLNGVIYDSQGGIAATRAYAMDGTCKDADEDHRIAIFHEQ